MKVTLTIKFENTPDINRELDDGCAIAMSNGDINGYTIVDGRADVSLDLEKVGEFIMGVNEFTGDAVSVEITPA